MSKSFISPTKIKKFDIKIASRLNLCLSSVVIKNGNQLDIDLTRVKSSFFCRLYGVNVMKYTYAAKIFLVIACGTPCLPFPSFVPQCNTNFK